MHPGVVKKKAATARERLPDLFDGKAAGTPRRHKFMTRKSKSVRADGRERHALAAAAVAAAAAAAAAVAAPAC